MDSPAKKPDIFEKWVDFSLRKPWTILICVGAVLAVSTFFALRLKLHSDFMELLPTDSPSVVNLESLKQRISSYSTLTIAVQSPDLKASEKFAEDLVAKLHEFPKERIKYIDYNLRDLRSFYEKNKWFYADLPDLVDFRDRLQKRIKEETEAEVFENVDDEEPAKPKTDLRIEELKKKYSKKTSEQDRYPDGYYVTSDRTLLAIFVRPPSSAAGFEESEKLVKDVRGVIDSLNPRSYHPEMKVGFTGDVKTGLEERDALANDMKMITLLCVIFIFAVIIIYYRSLRSIFITGLPVFVGIMMSFAIAYFAIGYLNSATAFLSSIIAGNGINFMIMLAARFYEEIHISGSAGLKQALNISVRGSFLGTIVAACAASIAYGSLIVAGFRGFRQFGIIGGAGMLICWLVTFAMGPALITVFHRWKPLGRNQSKKGHFIADKIGFFVVKKNRWILLFSLLLSAACVIFIIPYSFDPFEYDFHRLRNRVSAKRGSAKLSLRVDKIFDLPQSPTPVVVDELDDAPAVKHMLLKEKGARAVIGDVKTIFDYLPSEQEKKLEVLSDIRKMVDRKIDFLSDEEQKKVLEYRPPDDLRILTVNDVPEVVARPFTESDGTRGRILYVYSHPSESLLDGKYLLKFANFLRSFKLRENDFVAVGQPLIFADMVTAVLHDGIKVTATAVILVLLLLVVTFRAGLGIWTVLVSVMLGTLWMVGFAALADVKLNFLNFVVIPITLGIGVDYGANIFSRYRLEGRGHIADVIRTTGGAVTLASLTTIIGYATLISSTNMALQSFGIMADIGEITCLFTAEIAMTALIVWIESHRRKNL
jgi:predicted RND superfamily exporter protein